MSEPGAAIVEAARRLIGCPFRLHGRDPATGLDCVGLICVALAASGAHPVAPSGYSLRNLSIAQWLPLAHRSGLVLASGLAAAGDVLLIALPHSQHHLVIAADPSNVIHAHAGLRRVVQQPLDPAWAISARWRAKFPTEG